jgi:hypothetical protein
MPYTKTESKRIRIDRLFANQTLTSTPPSFSTETRVFGRTKTGNYLPNWRKVIASGGNATTDFDAGINDLEVILANSKLTYSSRPNASSPWEFRYSQESSWRTFVSIDPIGHFNILTAAFFEKARAKAIRALYKAIWEANHQFQGGVFAGETKKTADMIVKTAKNLRQGVLAYISRAVGIRQGKGGRKSKERAIADSYLEAVFGWQPLIHDCKDLAKALGRLRYESNRVRFRAYGEEEGEYSKSAGTSTFGFLYMNHHTYETAKVQVLYRGFLQGPKFEKGMDHAETIVSMSGFDLRSFVPTLWELTPYSFLVDYFANIGDLLQALVTDTSMAVGVWKTEIWESKREVTLIPDVARTSQVMIPIFGINNIRDIAVTGGVGKYTTTSRNVSRRASGVPLMAPRFTGLGDLSVKQFFNIGALILSKTR